MAVNYAAKFDAKVDERFAKEALSTGIINQDFDFTGVALHLEVRERKERS